MKTAKLILDGNEYEFPVVVGSENEVGIDFTSLRARTGAISLDPGYGNTGSCLSSITYISGEKGILRYRGYPIEQVAESASFMEVCYLLLNGELPTKDELDAFEETIRRHTMLNEGMLSFFKGFFLIT